MLLSVVSHYKNAYAGLSRETWLLSLIMLINRSGTMVVPFMSLYMTSPAMGYSLSQAGFVYGCFGAGSFVGAYLGGKLTDRIGFYKVQLAALLGGAVLFWLLGQMRSLHAISLVTFLLSLVNEAFRPANSTAIAYYCSVENRTRSYSLNRLAVNLGWAVGSATGGVIAKFSYAWLFRVDGFTNFLAAALMWLFLRNIGKTVAMEKKSSAGVIPRGDTVYRDKVYLYFIVLVTIFSCCFFQLFSTVSVYFKKEMNFSEPGIGFMMALNGLMIVLVEMILVYKLEAYGKPIKIISWGVMIVALYYLVLAIGPVRYWMAVSLAVLITIGEILAMPFMNSFWIARSRNHNRGEYAALFTMAWSTAQTIGPFLSAQLADATSFRFTWLVVGLICATTALLFRFSRQFA